MNADQLDGPWALSVRLKTWSLGDHRRRAG
jgi:hypothetical protein